MEGEKTIADKSACHGDVTDSIPKQSVDSDNNIELNNVTATSEESSDYEVSFGIQPTQKNDAIGNLMPSSTDVHHEHELLFVNSDCMSPQQNSLFNPEICHVRRSDSVSSVENISRNTDENLIQNTVLSNVHNNNIGLIQYLERKFTSFNQKFDQQKHDIDQKFTSFDQKFSQDLNKNFLSIEQKLNEQAKEFKKERQDLVSSIQYSLVKHVNTQQISECVMQTPSAISVCTVLCETVTTKTAAITSENTQLCQPVIENSVSNENVIHNPQTYLELKPQDTNVENNEIITVSFVPEQTGIIVRDDSMQRLMQNATSSGENSEISMKYVSLQSEISTCEIHTDSEHENIVTGEHNTSLTDNTVCEPQNVVISRSRKTISKDVLVHEIKQIQKLISQTSTTCQVIKVKSQRRNCTFSFQEQEDKHYVQNFVYTKTGQGAEFSSFCYQSTFHLNRTLLLKFLTARAYQTTIVRKCIVKTTFNQQRKLHTHLKQQSIYLNDTLRANNVSVCANYLSHCIQTSVTKISFSKLSKFALRNSRHTTIICLDQRSYHNKKQKYATSDSDVLRLLRTADSSFIHVTTTHNRLTFYRVNGTHFTTVIFSPGDDNSSVFVKRNSPRTATYELA